MTAATMTAAILVTMLLPLLHLRLPLPSPPPAHPCPLCFTSQVFGFLRKHIHEEETLNEVKRMTLTADGQGAVFDVPTAMAKVRRGQDRQRPAAGQHSGLCIARPGCTCA